MAKSCSPKEKSVKEIKTLVSKVVTEYATAVSRHGVGSKETKAIRKKYSNDTEFIDYANAMDRLYTRLKDVRRK